ncbi:hypothetical protein BSL78_28151 [Apostichopus japonicus]|uniref:NTR domain-containing protein n=2 Tax=Stichopus japonicus TaxID=307972 RepID=A0A2G8JH34_STIJA|nr:hypothetical protein BSL78_28151 [Apostichopus japonicus]
MEEYDNDFPQIPSNMYIPGDDLIVLPTTSTESMPESFPIGRIPTLRKVQAPRVPVLPPMMVNDGYWEKRGKLKYVVQVEKVFKGKERILKNSKVVIHTDLGSNFCGMTNLNLEERYLISGSFNEGELSVYLCDWVERTTDLTKTQRRGLRHFYSKYCDTCQIETGSVYFHRDSEVKTVCSYNYNLYPSVDCEAKYSSCIMRPNGTCGWYKGKDFKMCKRESNLKRNNVRQ